MTKTYHRTKNNVTETAWRHGIDDWTASLEETNGSLAASVVLHVPLVYKDGEEDVEIRESEDVPLPGEDRSSVGEEA